MNLNTILKAGSGNMILCVYIVHVCVSVFLRVYYSMCVLVPVPLCCPPLVSYLHPPESVSVFGTGSPLLLLLLHCYLEVRHLLRS